jgi:hypothetical protein
MANDPKSVPSGRLARWLLLVALLAAGIVLYFRSGTSLPTFGASAASDTTR